MILRTVHFLGIGALVMYAVVFAAGWLLHPSPAGHDTPQMRDAIAQISANVSQAVTYYDLEWNDPPHVTSATTVDGNTVVTLEVRISENVYDGSAAIHHEFLLRGVVTPKNKLLGKLKVVSSRIVGTPKAT